MMRRILVSGPRYVTAGPTTYKLVRTSPQRRMINVTHMVAVTQVGTDATITVPSSGPLSALRAVALNADGKAVYSHSMSLATASVVGVTTTSTSSEDQSITIQTAGGLTNDSWSFVPGADVFVGLSGQLVQSLPVGSFIACVGVALSPTKLLINIVTPLEL